MANTKHLTIRLPLKTYESLQREAAQQERSLAWIINRKLAGVEWRPIPDGSLVPDAPPPYVEVTIPQLKAHQEAMRKEPLGSGSLCPECNGLKGLHQKGCKANQKRRSP